MDGCKHNNTALRTMDIDKSFRLVFNNKVIRLYIFKVLKDHNDTLWLGNRKYSKCSIKWAVMNKHFNLLIYKLQKEKHRRKEFSNDHFYYFLEHNTDLQLLKDLFEIFPNLLPKNHSESSKLIEHCCLGRSNFISVNYSTNLIINHNYKYKDKEEILDFIIEELKIIPNLKAINNLFVDGNNLKLFKKLIEKGYYSIEKHGDIGLLLCALKSKDFQFYKLVLESCPKLRSEFYEIDNYIISQLLVHTGDIRFYSYSFDEMLKDPSFISKSYPSTIYPDMYNLNSHAIEYGTFEIIEYLANNFKFYPSSHVHKSVGMFLHRTSKKSDDHGCSSLKLFKYFFNVFKSSLPNSLLYVFNNCITQGKLDCLIYMKQEFGGTSYLPNNLFQQIKTSFSNYKFEIETFKWLIKFENDGSLSSSNCSKVGFYTLMDVIENTPISNYKKALGLILDKECCSPRGINDQDILNVISRYSFFRNEKEHFDILSSFIVDQSLKPEFEN